MFRLGLNMSFVRYFAYGSNLYPPRLAARIRIEQTLGVLTLSGWGLRFHKPSKDGSGKGNLIAAAGERAHGVVYEIGEDAKTVLDKIEGLGHGYELEWAETPQFGPVFFYRAQDALDDRLRPYDWYHAFVLAGARHHGLPRELINYLGSIDVNPDPDRARAEENARILSIMP
ncbi:MAG: gamma-glutamylcyclotransferase family protein [Pseudomonadota bacterium]